MGKIQNGCRSPVMVYSGEICGLEILAGEHRDVLKAPLPHKARYLIGRNAEAQWFLRLAGDLSPLPGLLAVAGPRQHVRCREVKYQATARGAVSGDKGEGGIHSRGVDIHADPFPDEKVSSPAS